MGNSNEELVAQRIFYWIEHLERQAGELLRDLPCEELPLKERAALAMKYLSLLQRFLLLAQKSKWELPSNDAQRVLNSIKAFMRGEWPLGVPEDKKGDLSDEHRDSGS